MALPHDPYDPDLTDEDRQDQMGRLLDHGLELAREGRTEPSDPDDPTNDEVDPPDEME
jgi:hypothetical protein